MPIKAEVLEMTKTGTMLVGAVGVTAFKRMQEGMRGSPLQVRVRNDGVMSHLWLAVSLYHTCGPLLL